MLCSAALARRRGGGRFEAGDRPRLWSPAMLIAFDGIYPQVRPRGVRPLQRQRRSATCTSAPAAASGSTAVLRGDVHHIRIGARTSIQDNSTVHVTTGRHPTIVGDDVTVGHNVVLHGCTIGDRCLIGIGAIVLDRCVIGDDCLIGAGQPGSAGDDRRRRSAAPGQPGQGGARRSPTRSASTCASRPPTTSPTRRATAPRASCRRLTGDGRSETGDRGIGNALVVVGHMSKQAASARLSSPVSVSRLPPPVTLRNRSSPRSPRGSGASMGMVPSPSGSKAGQALSGSCLEGDAHAAHQLVDVHGAVGVAVAGALIEAPQLGAGGAGVGDAQDGIAERGELARVRSSRARLDVSQAARRRRRRFPPLAAGERLAGLKHQRGRRARSGRRGTIRRFPD